MNSSIVFAVLAILASASARPGFLYSHPIATQDTTVVRDALGNQATAYAYQNGHSAVAVSRNDVSKHLVAHVAPVVAAPVVTYEHHAAPVVATHAYQTHAYAAYPNAYSYNPYYNYNGHYYY